LEPPEPAPKPAILRNPSFSAAQNLPFTATLKGIDVETLSVIFFASDKTQN
jgi:hypothetical protein